MDTGQNTQKPRPSVRIRLPVSREESVDSGVVRSRVGREPVSHGELVDSGVTRSKVWREPVDTAAKVSSPELRRRKKKKVKKSDRGKYQRFWQIREQWKLFGFFEIKQDHEFYDLTCMLKEGLRISVQDAIDEGTTDDVLCESHYTAVLRQLHEGFEMRTYANTVFARLRQALGMVDADYQYSLSCENSYLQFISNSKSNADFFLTNDKHYFLKTQSKREIRFILSKLPKYIEHLENYPHSLLVKYLGIHSIIIPHEKEKYFTIMQSIFYPHERITERFDIKGCRVGRWTDPAPENSEIIMVLKDLNFEGKEIFLDLQRDWFVQQMQLDTGFLKELHVIDYSLLVGLQPLHEDERALNQAVTDLIARTTAFASQDNLRAQPSTVTATDDNVSTVTEDSSLYRLTFPGPRSTLHNLLTFYLMQRSSYEMPPPAPSRSEFFIREILAMHMAQGTLPPPQVSFAEMDAISEYPSNESLINDLSISQNRRFLCSAKNPFHIIDGPNYRYYVGIIDFFTVYGFRKKLENLWKRIRYQGQSFSTVNPSHYAERLCQWVEEHTK